MDQNRASTTALIGALIRAYDLENGSPPLIDDRIAPLLFDPVERRALEDRVLAPWLPPGIEPPGSDQERTQALAVWYRQAGAAAVVLSRARFAEDVLFESLSDGVGQYVVLGAGMDTFAFRVSGLAASFRVFEVDHPATQAGKRSRLTSAGLQVPMGLRFVPVDLEREELASALGRTNFDAGLPSVFSWLGVTMYLTAESIAATLRGIRALSAARSRVVFDYIDLDVFDPTKAHPAVYQMIQWIAATRGQVDIISSRFTWAERRTMRRSSRRRRGASACVNRAWTEPREAPAQRCSSDSYGEVGRGGRDHR